MREQIQSDFDKIIKTLKISKEEIQIKKDIGELSFYNDYSATNKVDTSIFIDGLEHNKIIFINGRIEKIDFSYEDKNKIEIKDEIEKNISFDYENSLIDLNSAFINKVFKIIVNKNYSLKKPLIIYHSTNDKVKSTNINLRLDFELGENSCLKLIDYFANNTTKNFINIFYNFNLIFILIIKIYFFYSSIYKNNFIML